MKISITITYLSICLSACNNYDLVDKLSDPGQASGSTSGGNKLYAFVNPTATTGSMSGLTNGGCTGSGIQQADCSCQDFAVANGLITSANVKFIAWLSNATQDMTCRLPGGSGNNCSVPTGTKTWYNMIGEPIATSFQDLLDGNLTNPVKYQPNKQPTGSAKIWTGTDASGLRGNGGAATSNCTNWTDGTSTGSAPIYGTPTSTGVGWSNTATDPNCSAPYTVYCFQVP